MIFIPYATGQIINEVSSGEGSPDTVRPWVISGAVAAIAIIVLAFVEERIYARINTNATRRVQNDLSESIQTLSLGFFGLLDFFIIIDSFTALVCFAVAVTEFR